MEFPYDAQLDIWQAMGYKVAEKYHVRPFEVISQWSSREVLISYGLLVNELSRENYLEYKNLDAKSRNEAARKAKRVPTPYGVKFKSFEQLQESTLAVDADSAVDPQVAAFMQGGGSLGG